MASRGVHCLLPGRKVAAWAEGPDVQYSSGWPCQCVLRSWPDHLTGPTRGGTLFIASALVVSAARVVARVCAPLLLPLVRAGCLSSASLLLAADWCARRCLDHGCAPLGWLSRVASMALWSLALIATRTSARVSPTSRVTGGMLLGVGRANRDRQNPSLTELAFEGAGLAARHRTGISAYGSSQNFAGLHKRCCACAATRYAVAEPCTALATKCRAARAPRDAAAASHGLQGRRRALLAQGHRAQLISVCASL